MKKVLIDTNVVVDALTSREPWCLHAEEIFLMVANEQVEGCLTASAITDIHDIIRKHTKDVATTNNALSDLMSLFRILDVNGEDCIYALASPMKVYEDAVVAQVARRHQMDCIVTRNLKDFEDCEIQVISPEMFVKTGC